MPTAGIVYACRLAGADPAQHVAWYKAMGANVIQTFCVSYNGYAWYPSEVAPVTPELCKKIGEVASQPVPAGALTVW